MKWNPTGPINRRIRFVFSFSIILLINGILVVHVIAQRKDTITLAQDENPFSLIAEDSYTHALVYLVVGKIVRIKVGAEEQYEKGHIIGITDSTITFQSEDFVHPPIRLSDLVSLKIPRSALRKGAGVLAMGYGAAFMVGGVYIATVDAGGPEFLAAVFFEAIAYGALRIGMILLKSRQIDLHGAWVLHPTRAIVPGNLIRVILKNGEVISKMKVREVSASKIKGQAIGIDANGNRFRRSAVVVIENILECSRIAPESK